MHFDPEQFKTALPFIGLMAQDQRARPYLTRLIEQTMPGAIVGLTVAFLTIWKSDSLQDQRIATATQQAAEAVERVKAIEIDRVKTRLELMERLHSIERKLDKVTP